MVTKKKKGTAITALCANLETEEFVRVPIFVRATVKSAKKVEKIAREHAEALSLNFIKADNHIFNQASNHYNYLQV